MPAYLTEIASASDEGQTAAADAYGSFVDQVLALARTADFKPPVGRDDRLKGFHGG